MSLDWLRVVVACLQSAMYQCTTSSPVSSYKCWQFGIEGFTSISHLPSHLEIRWTICQMPTRLSLMSPINDPYIHFTPSMLNIDGPFKILIMGIKSSMSICIETLLKVLRLMTFTFACFYIYCTIIKKFSFDFVTFKLFSLLKGSHIDNKIKYKEFFNIC